MTQDLSGQLGNQLFQANFLLQLSKVLKSEVRFPQSDVLKMLCREEYQEPNFLDTMVLKRNEFSLQDIESTPKDKFIEEIDRVLLKGDRVYFKPGILGSVFFDFLWEDPKVFFRIPKPKLVVRPNPIVLHFRGRDFSSWDINAIMEENYYLNAIKYCQGQIGTDMNNLILLTDEPKHKTVKGILNSMPDIKLSSCSELEDLDIMANADFLISSPSTFSIWGKILSKKAKLIMNQNWLDYKCNLGDKFWKDLRKSENPILAIHKEIPN
jgi:hypothetical protein